MPQKSYLSLWTIEQSDTMKGLIASEMKIQYSDKVLHLESKVLLKNIYSLTKWNTSPSYFKGAYFYARGKVDENNASFIFTDEESLTVPFAYFDPTLAGPCLTDY